RFASKRAASRTSASEGCLCVIDSGVVGSGDMAQMVGEEVPTQLGAACENPENQGPMSSRRPPRRRSRMSELALAPMAPPTDLADLDVERELDVHRRELTGYCYRMLGSGSEA